MSEQPRRRVRRMRLADGVTVRGVPAEQINSFIIGGDITEAIADAREALESMPVYPEVDGEGGNQ